MSASQQYLHFLLFLTEWADSIFALLLCDPQ